MGSQIHLGHWDHRGELINWVQQKSISLVNWPQYTYVIGWQKTNEFISSPLLSSCQKWPSVEDAGFWSVQLDPAGLSSAVQFSSFACSITIKLDPVEQSKSPHLHLKAISRTLIKHSEWSFLNYPNRLVFVATKLWIFHISIVLTSIF